MSKDNTGGGFLSKMAQIVKRPSGGWNDLDTQVGHRDSQYSKQVLAEMIERKRRNDFVRKREFDMLRKLRNRINEAEQIQGGRPSFFQSSYSSKPDDNRAGTLKKINEIEEQMAQQWWKTRHDAPRTEPPPPHLIDPRRGVKPAPPEQARPRPMQAGGAPVAGGHQVSSSAMERTQQLPRMTQTVQQGRAVPSGGNPIAPTTATKAFVASPPPIANPQTATAKTPSPPPQHTPGTPLSLRTEQPQGAAPAGVVDVSLSNDAVDGTSSLFTASKFYALDVQELALDPDIEEASIRFASGDDDAAEQGLLEILKRDGGGTVDEWRTLFDLYRAIDRAEAFENLAIDFANRFSTSAPQWFSMKAEVAARVGAVTTQQATSSLGKATWVADKVVEPYAATVLAKLLERTPQPWVLDWTALGRIEPGAVPALIQLFKMWANTSVDLRFVSAATLRDCLERATISGNAAVDHAWWELRLLALRVMNMGDDFEPVAIDYCVTYELSPPSWEPPVCRFRSLHTGETTKATSKEGRQPMFVESQLHDSLLPADSEISGFSASQLSLDWPVAYLEGEILNDAQAALSAIDKQLESSPVLVISCKYLIRVDFSSAGNILNWASAHQREGRLVRFVNVHRLIAAFFHVVGVTESAKIVTWTD